MSNEKCNQTRVKITDTTLRDGHQSLIATRMQTSDMVKIAGEMDQAGFYSAEVWGGATFDVSIRYLNEDPWQRLRMLKELMPRTPLQMLVRGQSLVGYRQYPDDVVEAFIRHAAATGIDIFRVFDALNDERNMETCLKAIKQAGKHAQLTICYSLTQRKMGGPIYNLDYYLKKANILQEMGADSICIKDMAGLLAPDDAFNLTSTFKKELRIPVQLHTHYTAGMASMSYLKAVEAGVDAIDTALAPFALRSGQPAIEPMVVALEGTPRDTGLDLTRLLKLDEYFETVAGNHRSQLNQTKISMIDTTVLVHQVPGGMISNLVAQLKQVGALERLPEVYAEIPRVRRELGYPPLVTPTSQIVGVQAVQNVLVGRYKLIPTQVMDYCYGLYGRPPAPIDPEVLKLVLKHYKKGKTPVTGRPADYLKPEMESARDSVKAYSNDISDILTAALYRIDGTRFVRAKYSAGGLPHPEMIHILDE
jgi:pyruvate carboxylase subunit B